MSTVRSGTEHAQRALSNLIIKRFFTKAPAGGGRAKPLDSVVYETREARVLDTDDKVVFEMDGVEVPKEWSQHATNITATKYFRKAGVPDENGGGPERSVKAMVSRVASAIRASGEAQGYFQKEQADVFQDELESILINQRGAFNSPVWFNVGLFESYGIKGNPAGNYGVQKERDGTRFLLTPNAYSRPQCSACFILTVKDDLMDIAEEVKREMRLFKFGSGAGSNFSNLRAKGENLSGGGTSSGMMSFLEILDKAAGAIKSGGTTRRAAKMVVVDIDHPDALTFIDWKVREEDKARALIEAGFSGGMDGEALRTVSGQNANNSVRVTDDFMHAVLEDGEYNTTWRLSGEVAQTLKARETFRRIARAAWRCADPGLQFHDTVNKWHTCPQTAPIRASNPCVEFMFIDDTACNLASLNLVRFEREDGSFDIPAFRHASRILFIAQEILVDYASYPSREIAENSHRFRPLGLGYANLGALLMRAGIPYASENGRNYAAGITALMTGVAYATSAEMAAQRGPFSGFDLNKASMMRVMAQHQEAAKRLRPRCVGDPFGGLFEAAHAAWDRAVALGEEHGYRNAQASLLAPTGTIALMMDCDTTGIEPDFQLVKHKALAGGGTMKIANQSVPMALLRMGYPDSERDAILAHLKEHETVEGAPFLRDEHLGVFDCANPCGDGRRFIAPMGHIRMMAAVQPFLSGAISKTVNVPNRTTAEEVEKLYLAAWQQGLKAVAIYRDNSKVTQVFGNGQGPSPSAVAKPKRKRLPKKRLGFTQEAKVGGQKVYLRTGEYLDGTLGEIFIDLAKDGASLRSWANVFAIAISMGLQYGVPLEKFVSAFTFTRFEPAGTVSDHPHIKFATSFVDYIFRLLGLEYLDRTDLVQAPPEMSDKIVAAVEEAANVAKASTKTDAPFCTQCGHPTQRTGTCYRCNNCGLSTGCA